MSIIEYWLMAFDSSNGEGTTVESADSSLSEAVVQAVGEVDDTDPVDLPPLYDQIDPDALENLFRDVSNGVVAFDYHDYTVLVRADGTASVK